jgi:hypothetical protein
MFADTLEAEERISNLKYVHQFRQVCCEYGSTFEVERDESSTFERIDYYPWQKNSHRRKRKVKFQEEAKIYTFHS